MQINEKKTVYNIIASNYIDNIINRSLRNNVLINNMNISKKPLSPIIEETSIELQYFDDENSTLDIYINNEDDIDIVDLDLDLDLDLANKKNISKRKKEIICCCCS